MFISVTCPSKVGEKTPSSAMTHHHTVGWARLDQTVREVLTRLQDGDASLLREDLEELVDLAKAALTVTLDEDMLQMSFHWITAEQAKEVVSVAKRVQEHTCGKICGKMPLEGQDCSLFFPRLPSFFTLVSRLPNLAKAQDRQAFLQPIEALQFKVQVMLRELRRTGQLATTSLSFLLASVDPSPPQQLEGGGLSWCGLSVPAGGELDYMLARCSQVAGLGEQEVKRTACWQWCLLYRQYPRVILARRVVEAYMANYSPAMLLTLKANHEVDLVTSSPFKLFSYLTKGGVASNEENMRRVFKELEERGDEMKATYLKELVRKYKLRQAPLTEAMYVLTPGISLSNSNVGVVFKNLKKVEESQEEDGNREEEDEEAAGEEEDEDYRGNAKEDNSYSEEKDGCRSEDQDDVDTEDDEDIVDEDDYCIR